MLYFHVPSRHPSSTPELELPTLLQVTLWLLMPCRCSTFNLRTTPSIPQYKIFLRVNIRCYYIQYMSISDVITSQIMGWRVYVLKMFVTGYNICLEIACKLGWLCSIPSWQMMWFSFEYCQPNHIYSCTFIPLIKIPIAWNLENLLNKSK
jgi:hypothetical protein